MAARATDTRVRSSGFGARCGTFLVNVTLSATERLILCVKHLAKYESNNRGGKLMQPPVHLIRVNFSVAEIHANKYQKEPDGQ